MKAIDFVLPRTVWVNAYEDGTMSVPCSSPERAKQDAASMRVRGIGLVEVLTYRFSDRNEPEPQPVAKPRQIDELRWAIQHENGELTIRGSGASQVWPADFQIRLRDRASDDVIVRAKDAAEAQCAELAQQVSALTRERDQTAELLETATKGAIDLAARIAELERQVAHEAEQRNLRHNAYVEATAKATQLCEAVNRACIGHDQPITHEQALDGIRELQRVYEQSWEIAQQAPSCAAATPIGPDKRTDGAPSDSWAWLEKAADAYHDRNIDGDPLNALTGWRPAFIAAVRAHVPAFPATRYPEVVEFLDATDEFDVRLVKHRDGATIELAKPGDLSSFRVIGKTIPEACRAALEHLKGQARPIGSPATAQQPAPAGNGQPITPLVIADLEERSRVGASKYGTPLRSHNGRDALTDAYQEALDLTQYLRQAIAERDPQPTT